MSRFGTTSAKSLDTRRAERLASRGSAEVVGVWDCPTRGRVSGSRTRPRGARRGEETREPRSPALRLPFPGQRSYLHRRSHTWRRQKSRGARRGSGSGCGRRRRGARRTAAEAGDRRRLGPLSRPAGHTLGPAGRRGGRTWQRERRVARGWGRRAAWTAAPLRPAPVRAPDPRAPPPDHAASATAWTQSGRPEPLSPAAAASCMGERGPRSGRCPGRSCPCRRVGRRRATSTARSTT